MIKMVFDWIQPLSVTNTITTHTDFVNKTTTNLQITNYNFPATSHHPETCVGVVKASHVHQKSPSQHMADLTMLEKMGELSHLFRNKLVEYVRVDGASDEGPSHLEVQFLWTERHYKKGSLVTMITSRCSGDSRLNRVELQNSHLSKGHSNTFIPSTLAGSHTNEDGKLICLCERCFIEITCLPFMHPRILLKARWQIQIHLSILDVDLMSYGFSN